MNATATAATAATTAAVTAAYIDPKIKKMGIIISFLQPADFEFIC